MAPDTIEAREHLVQALEADLIGPYDGAEAGESSAEVLPLPPSRWYLTGFLAPMDAREVEDAQGDELGAGPDLDVEDGAAEAGPQRKNLLPASFGLSVLLPAPGARSGAGEDAIEVEASWATYVAEEHDDESERGEARTRTEWRRIPQPVIRQRVPLDADRLRRGIELTDAAGVWLQGRLEAANAPGLPSGTRALSLFLVNRRGRGDKGRADERFLFQVRFALGYAPGFVPRPNWRGEDTTDGDEQIADLQFRGRATWAVGHGVATAAEVDADGGVRRVVTAWIPRAEVAPVKAATVEGLETSMAALADACREPATLVQMLGALPAAYGAWLEEQAQIDPGSANRRQTRDRLITAASRARARIEEGIALLGTSGEVRQAFALMNRAMAMQAERTRPGQTHRWRLFQLAFVLLNLPSVADARHADREQVELIYFPTGGGKTEAYLGVIAFVMLLRRLRGQGRPDAGDGVAVLLRYTLRLLTLDQLRRAATLVCALELLRREAPDRLGTTRFAVGLWVGKTATANTLKEVAEQVTKYKTSGGTSTGSPFPLTVCPWCKTPLGPANLRLVPSIQRPTSVQVHCASDHCAFHVDESRDGLPVLFVDEQVYRELPAFLVATVDKMAMLPWRGETGMLFGRAQWRDADAAAARAFYGPLDRPPAGGVPLPDGLLPPELIVQDELHLISGPLGTMVGLYETVVETLSTRDGVRPKVIAATATVRQATEQIRALFGRTAAPAVFPPPAVDDGETFFATVDRESPGRLYVGLAASGRPMKVLLLRAYVALLAAAARVWDELQGDTTADGYQTLAGYFNSLRELGGMRRLVEDEVAWRVARQVERRPAGADPRRWFRNRTIAAEPSELTSRESTARIAEIKADLDRRHGEKGSVDVLLASNMISVGVDIDRLGLMVVAGQPKTTAEYIQASSRVGRQPQTAPGLVVTCYNVYRPRDRSHYEHFVPYHQSFYRDVEASSLTPFSGPALDRGLAGAIVALTRHLDPAMTPNAAAVRLAEHRAIGEAAVAALTQRALRHRSLSEEEVARRAGDLEQLGKALLDTWEQLVEEAVEGAGGRRYSPYDRDRQGGRPLLHTVLDPDAVHLSDEDRRFAAPTSMRDVEPTVHLWLERQPLGGRTR